MILPDPKSIWSKGNPIPKQSEIIGFHYALIRSTRNWLVEKKNDHHKYSLAQVMTMQIVKYTFRNTKSICSIYT